MTTFWRYPTLPPSFPLLILALTVCLGTARAETGWPNWRGPNGNGSVTSGTFPVKWNASSVAWKVALPGKGTSTPIVHQDRIYVTSPAQGQDALLAFDLTGRSLWEVKLGTEDPPKHRTLASSGNASPVTDGKSIFVYFKSGNFAAVALDGTVRWKINLVERFGRDDLFWDQGSSPMLTEEHVIMARLHGGESWIAAFDKGTGELRWKQARNYDAPAENDNGYTTPVLFDHAGKKALLVWGADHLTAHDATNGKVFWSCGGFNPEGTGYWPAIATPAIAGNIAVVPVGRDDRTGQARLHGIRLGGSGDVSATHRVWKREDLGVFVTSPTVYKGHVYLLRHKGQVVCRDLTNGRTIWTGSFPEHRAPYYSSPVVANGVLFAAREDGTVFSARVEEKFELLGENPMDERVIASPVPGSNRLFIRGDKHLFCVGK
ncbi:MAG: PQQ-like beta-propeller repeat protein [Verrucomicrobia bacterium]|nr:PQQ-like beta-propeller repeat protein [Verrucomicrobiota bacterium]